MFTNPWFFGCYLRAGLHRNFPFCLRKKLQRGPGKGRTQYNLVDGVTASALLYALHSDRARSFDQ